MTNLGPHKMPTYLTSGMRIKPKNVVLFVCSRLVYIELDLSGRVSLGCFIWMSRSGSFDKNEPPCLLSLEESHLLSLSQRAKDHLGLGLLFGLAVMDFVIGPPHWRPVLLSGPYPYHLPP